jgi:Xaa-Pro aminopeptidase
MMLRSGAEIDLISCKQKNQPGGGRPACFGETMNDSDNILIVADSEHDANMLYAVGMFVPDPFIYFRYKGECNIVMNDLEIDRARKNAPHCRIVSHSQCVEKLRRHVNKQPTLAAIISMILQEKRLHKIFVPADFPFGLARELRHHKIKVRVKKGGVFPQREFKRSDEVKKISAALMMAEVGLAEGIQALKTSKITRDRKLVYRGAPLTSEKLRAIIDTAIIGCGGLACHTIVAGGRQSCDPHEQGHGLLRAHEPIVMDVFPRSQKTGYFGDITRTVVRGRASEAIRRLYATVARGQEIGFEKMTCGAAGSEIHQAVQSYFDSQGYKTGRRNGRMEGFFHGLGHGVGMEIHEAPRVSLTSKDILQNGHVATVEPGLYYPQLGGVRLEDVVSVETKGPRNLTKFEKLLEV